MGGAQDVAVPAQGGAPGYRGPQVCKIVGITYRQLDYWARTDLLRPSLVDAKGSGSQRLYSYQDLLELKVIKQLLDAGVKLQSARKAIDCLRQSGEDLAAANLVLGATGTVLARSDEQLVDLLRGGQGVFNVVPLASVLDEVDAAIHAIGDGAPSAPVRVEPDGVARRAEGQ
ncbi:MAG: MerR family transcriptional regulator [Actinomycetota bacterium]|nr:MerR family transcriptional regulator [Actinomycetota bacterium]